MDGWLGGLIDEKMDELMDKWMYGKRERDRDR